MLVTHYPLQNRSHPVTTALPQDTARNADLADLHQLLTNQHARVEDYVVPAPAISAHGGLIKLAGVGEPQLTVDGVTAGDALLRPTEVFDEGVAEKLRIPLAYVRRMRTERPDLYDFNLNGWLHGSADGEYLRDERRFLVRTFRGDDDGIGVARALLGNSYKVIDNLDVLMTVLSGVAEAGAEVDVRSCDLSDRRMYVKVNAPGVTALAPALLGGYRSPFGDADIDAARRHDRSGRLGEPGTSLGMAGNAPIVSAGLRISNSEVGGGAFTITPEITALICTNGMLQTMDVVRNVHLGRRVTDDGLIKASERTQAANLELIKSRTIDAVRTFLSPGYLADRVAKIEEQAAEPLKDQPTETIQRVGKTLAWSEGEQAGILNHFIRGGQMTKGGVLNATTSYSQTVANPDRADELDSTAMRVLELA